MYFACQPIMQSLIMRRNTDREIESFALVSRCIYARPAYSMFYLPLSFRLIILICLASTGIVWGLAQGALLVVLCHLSSEEGDRLGNGQGLVLPVRLLLLRHQLPLLLLPALPLLLLPALLLLPLAFPPLPLALFTLPLALLHLPLAHSHLPMAQLNLPLPLARRQRRAKREVHPCSLVPLIRAGIRVS